MQMIFFLKGKNNRIFLKTCKISRQRSNNTSVKDRIKNYYGANFRSQNNDNRMKNL